MLRGAVHRPPNQARPGSRGEGHGWAGWLGGGRVVARGKADSTKKERERRERERAMPLTEDLTAYLKVDVSRLTYFWKR